MVKTKALWEGSVELNDILVSMDRPNQYKDESLENQVIDSIWKEYQTKYPASYNGSLVLLEDFEIDEKFTCGSELLTLYLGNINFSTLVALKKTGKSLKNNFGILGTQCMILSPDGTHILVGKRRINSDYCPGKLTIPGGMIETSDVYAINSCILREIQEEVKISLKNIKIKTLLKEHSNFSTIILLSADLNQKFKKDQVFTGNDEWEDNKLFWLSLEELKQIPDEELMEGLTYLKNKL
jgi:8-oxo-dGTP pyrophosphatase MutT (NUDIX family)